jgi:hypothetical protein
MIVAGMGIFLYKEKPGQAHGGFSFGFGEFFLVTLKFLDL